MNSTFLNEICSQFSYSVGEINYLNTTLPDNKLIALHKTLILHTFITVFLRGGTIVNGNINFKKRFLE